jgi:hypothetical protein
LSYQWDVSTLVYIINDNYKDGKKGDGIWYSLIIINISNMNNHFGSKVKKLANTTKHQLKMSK